MMTLVCTDCFGNKGLQRRIEEIRPQFPDEKCDFHPSKKGIPITEVAEIVDPVFRNEYTHGYYDHHYDDYAGDNLSGTLYELTEAHDDQVVNSLSDALKDGDNYHIPDGEDAFYSDDVTYTSNTEGYEERSHTWRLFCSSILHEQRFFNQKALNRLNEIFDGLHLLQDSKRRPAVYTIEPNSAFSLFFRSRKARSTSDRERIAKNPAKELGPPPEGLRRAGRMNPSGILTFYGAFDLDTCVAELRPAVGESVISAQFSLTRPILVLDTTQFSGKPKAENIFSSNHIEKMRLWKFMTQFMHEISKPSLPDDEHLDYIPTQVVSEYLSQIHKMKVIDQENKIDAIIYKSAQNEKGKNIAIFGAAAEVKEGPRIFNTLYSSNPALTIVKSSLVSHDVVSVTYSKGEVFTPTFNDEDNNGNRNYDGLPF